MSGAAAAAVVCDGWLRKSPPEKKLRRYAWKRRWFVLRSGRLSGEADVLQYYKNPQARRPIRTINLNLCEQVDAGLSFTKKELESSFVFDLRTQERTWYLVAESEGDMERWVSAICLLCGFNPTEEERPPVAGHAPAATSAPPPYEPVSVRHGEDDYLWLAHCQSHTRPPLGGSASLESLRPPPCASLPPHGAPSPPSSARTATWTVPLDAGGSPDLAERPGGQRSRFHPSPHPRKHSLDFHLRPVAISLDGETQAGPRAHSDAAGYQVPRPLAPVPRPRPLRRPSSTPSVDSLTQDELHAAAPAPPPRPPKPTGGGALPRSGAVSTSTGGTSSCESVSVPQSASDSVFEFSDSFSSYFLNKGMVPLGALCPEDDDVDQNYVSMSAAEPRADLRDVRRQGGNYVAMTPVGSSSSSSSSPSSVPAETASLGRRVPPPAHMGFRSSSLTPPLTSGSEAEALPPPVHRNLKPQRKGVGVEDTPAQSTHKARVKPAPLDMTAVQQAWQEVPPPVRSPVTRTFTRDPSCRRASRPGSPHSSSPSSDSDDPDDSYVAMTTGGLGAGESVLPASAVAATAFSRLVLNVLPMSAKSLRLTRHRASEGGAGSPSLRRSSGDKQVEYLDLDLHTGRTARQKRGTAEAGGAGRQKGGEERARGGRARVDYVVVDPKRTKALRNTREAWHDGRMSTEKEKV